MPETDCSMPPDSKPALLIPPLNVETLRKLNCIMDTRQDRRRYLAISPVKVETLATKIPVAVPAIVPPLTIPPLSKTAPLMKEMPYSAEIVPVLLMPPVKVATSSARMPKR